MDHSSMTLPPLDGLTAVLAAARSGSFTAAAEELGLTHGAVSRRVAAIEAWLGTPLFDRHGRGVRATPAGQRFAAEIERALSTIGRTADQWRPRRGLETVRLSVVPSFAKLWLLPRLAALQGEPADLLIDLRVEHRLSDLEGREADIAVRYGRGEWRRLRSRLLFAEQLLPVAAPHVAALLGADAPAAALAAQALIHDSDTSQWRSWLAVDGFRYRPRAGDRRFEDYDIVLAAAEAGLGLALLRLPLAQDRLDAQRLVPVSARAIRNPASHFVVMRRDEAHPAVGRLVERLIKMASRASPQ